MQYREENNYPKALLFSTGILALILVISYLIVFATAKPEEEEIGTGGIVVNYGTSETGMGDDFMSAEEPSTAPNANNSAPDKVMPEQVTETAPSAETSNKAMVTQNTEDAPTVTTSAKSTATTPSTSTIKKENKPTLNENALYKGNKNNGAGKGDGTGNTPGNQGDKDGDPMSANYGKGGSGFGNTKLELVGRSFVNLPRIEDNGQSSGRIVVEIRVGQDGQVRYARAGVKGTTLSDRNLWNKCEQAVMGARLNQLESAPDVQIGRVVFNFKVD